MAMDYADVENGLVHPAALWTRTQVRERPSPVPATAGVYAWYFTNPPSVVPLEGTRTWAGAFLLYVGISPKQPSSNSRPVSRQNLRKRIRSHYSGNASGSTLRLTLGCLLEDELGIRLQRVGSGSRLTFADGEATLSGWLDSHAFVTWVEHPEPWQPEHLLIRDLVLPLNLDQNRHSPFHSLLTEARAGARRRARESA